MNKGKYILVNGSFVPTEAYRISLSEAGLLHFSEKIRAIRTAFPFFRESLKTINLNLEIFNRPFPEFSENEGSGLKRQLERTLTRNKHFLGALLTLTFRFSGTEILYSIHSEKLEDADFTLNEKGLFVEIFDQIQKPVSLMSSLTVWSEMFWQVAENQHGSSSVDLFLLTNSANQIVEAPGSNIYILKGNKIKSAGISQGAYIDVTRSLMVNIFRNLNLEFSDAEGISYKDLYEGEELLLVNSIEGIRWVSGLGAKRYFNNTIRKISALFNQLTIS